MDFGLDEVIFILDILIGFCLIVLAYVYFPYFKRLAENINKRVRNGGRNGRVTE